LFGHQRASRFGLYLPSPFGAGRFFSPLSVRRDVQEMVAALKVNLKITKRLLRDGSEQLSIQWNFDGIFIHFVLFFVAEHLRSFTCGKLYYRTFHMDAKRDVLYVGAM
jgi:hypothetical protein